MVEIFYVCVYLLSLIFIGIMTIITGKTYGEAVDVHLDKITVFILFMLYVLTYIVIFRYYKRHKDNYINIKFWQFKVNKKKLHSFYFVCLLISIFGTVFWGIGRLGTNVTIKFSFLFNLIKVGEFFPIYYVVARDVHKKLYWINIILYCMLQTIQGWSGWILVVVVIELYFQEKRYGIVRRFFRIFNAKILSVFAILFGGCLYYYVYPLKNAIRYGVEGRWFRISLFESIIKLVERFCNFAVYTSVWQNIVEIKKMYKKQNIFLSEFKSSFCPLVPSFLMKDKDIRMMGNIVLQAMFPDLKNGTSTGFGFWMYWFALFECSIFDFMATMVLFIVGCIVTFLLFKAFDNKEHDCNILYLMFLLYIAEGASVSQLFGYGYIASIYLIIPMILLGIIKVYK